MTDKYLCRACDAEYTLERFTQILCPACEEKQRKEYAASLKEYFEKRYGENIDYGDLIEAFPNMFLEDIIQACVDLVSERRLDESHS